MPWDKKRLSLMDIFHQKRALEELGVFYELGRENSEGDPEVRIAGCRDGMLEEAVRFRDTYVTELRCVLCSKGDTKYLLALDFLRWRVDEEHFGPLPGLRRIIPTPRKEDSEE